MTNDLVSIEVRGIYQAYINLFFGGGSAAGAAFGGFLCDRIGWRMTFAVQIPILLAVFINGVFTTPSSLGPNLAKRSGQGIMDAMKGFDTAGSILLTGSVAFLILGLNLGGNVYPWKHPLVIASLVIAVVAGAIFIRVEEKAARPVMPLAMIFSKPRGNLVFNNFFAQLGINTIIFNAPLYFQAVKLESPSLSGFRLAGPSVALTICGVSSGFIMTATGRMKWLIVVGSMARNHIPRSSQHRPRPLLSRNLARRARNELARGSSGHDEHPDTLAEPGDRHGRLLQQCDPAERLDRLSQPARDRS